VLDVIGDPARMADVVRRDERNLHRSAPIFDVRRSMFDVR